METRHTRSVVTRVARKPALKDIHVHVEDEDGILDDDFHQSIIVLGRETDDGNVLTETRCNLYGNPTDVFPVLARTEKIIQEILAGFPLPLRMRYEKFKASTKHEQD